MDIEVKRMSPTAIEMLDQLSAVCKRFGVDYYAASQNQRDLLDSIAESCKPDTQIDRCGRFACAAFLIADSNGFTVWHFAFPPSY